VKGDTDGNLVYRRTAQNFNPAAAMSGRITVAEVEVLVNAGELEPELSTRPASMCSAWCIVQIR